MNYFKERQAPLTAFLLHGLFGVIRLSSFKIAYIRLPKETRPKPNLNRNFKYLDIPFA
jgi:hypothetical protein